MDIRLQALVLVLAGGMIGAITTPRESVRVQRIIEPASVARVAGVLGVKREQVRYVNVIMRSGQ